MRYIIYLLIMIEPILFYGSIELQLSQAFVWLNLFLIVILSLIDAVIQSSEINALWLCINKCNSLWEVTLLENNSKSTVCCVVQAFSEQLAYEEAVKKNKKIGTEFTVISVVPVIRQSS